VSDRRLAPASPFPWIFPYVEDPHSATRYPSESGRSVLRPFVEVSLPGMEQKLAALVDSGSEHTLVARWVAQTVGLDPADAVHSVVLGISGDDIRVDLVPGRMRLHPPDSDIDTYVEWETELGIVDRWRPTWSVLLGQIGFFDRFTVSMHRGALTCVVEGWGKFDERFGIRLAGPSPPNPRFRP